ncbi:hypothetical protein HX895_34770, partial [Pseudomonas gingeri]|nr:hypothetical protein [Pseudomonas gingeri]
VDRVQPLFELLQACRVGIEMIEEAVQFADGFLDLDLRAGQQVGGFAQCTEVATLQQKLLDEIETLNANDEAIERLGEELAAYARHYQERARELSDLRHQAAT